MGHIASTSLGCWKCHTGFYSAFACTQRILLWRLITGWCQSGLFYDTNQRTHEPGMPFKVWVSWGQKEQENLKVYHQLKLTACVVWSNHMFHLPMLGPTFNTDIVGPRCFSELVFSRPFVSSRQAASPSSETSKTDFFFWDSQICFPDGYNKLIPWHAFCLEQVWATDRSRANQHVSSNPCACMCARWSDPGVIQSTSSGTVYGTLDILERCRSQSDLGLAHTKGEIPLIRVCGVDIRTPGLSFPISLAYVCARLPNQHDLVVLLHT